MTYAATAFRPGQHVEIVPKARLWVAADHGIVTGFQDGYVTVQVGDKDHQFWPGYLRPATPAEDFVVSVRAEILPGKIDPSAAARFTNASRAGQYAAALAASGDYYAVYLTDAHGESWPITA